MKLKTIKSIKNLKGKKVLLRVDFNLPLDKRGRILDDTRIKLTLPTIKYLYQKGATIIILTHLGRPGGKVVTKLSTKVISQRLAKLLKKKVTHLKDLNINSSDRILMLENIRFQPREKMNCKRLSKKLAKLADIYVNDAFAVSHRAHSSISAITDYLPSSAGFQLEKEIDNLNKVLKAKTKPKVAIIGGVKLETKVKVIKNLLAKMDYVLLGGAVANNVLKAMDYEVGSSLVDDSQLKVAENIINNKLRLPVDAVVAKKIVASAKSKTMAVGQLSKKEIILDLGPDTINLYCEIIKSAKLIVWNGPLGYFEIAKYKKASKAVAFAVAASKSFSIIGGGETVQMIGELGLKNKFDFVSTGGGAMLEFLEGKILPGIKPLIKK